MRYPINRDFARYLKAEFATRFKVPVRYVLYTHKDWDHASGGVVFADTAEFVGHQNMRPGVALPPGFPPLPADAQKMDGNKNGLIERSEATGGFAERFDLFDENRNGMLSGAELIRGSVNDVYLPSTTFSDRHTVTFGGKRVMMIHLGVAHTNDSTVLYFPDERTVFSADVLQVKRLPQSLAPSVGAYIDALRTIVALDFDHAATGHALMGTKKDAAQSLQYPRGPLEWCCGGHRRGPQPTGDPEVAHARHVQRASSGGILTARYTSPRCTSRSRAADQSQARSPRTDPSSSVSDL